MTLHCIICLADTGSPPNEAIAVIQGYSVCEEHAHLVGFSRKVKHRIEESWKSALEKAKKTVV